MRLRFYCLPFALLLAALPCFAQDTILDLSGNELTGQVVEVNPTQVLYRPQGSDPALPPTVLEKRTLFMIRFANGTKETFANNLSPMPAPGAVAVPGAGMPLAVSGMSYADLYRKGQHDALILHDYKGAFWGTYGATLATGWGGFLAGGIIGSTRPHAVSNPMLDPNMLRHPAYVEGYEKQAQRRKLGEAAKGAGAGLATMSLLLLLYIMALTGS